MRGRPPVFPRFLILEEAHALDRPARHARCRNDVQSFIPNAITPIFFFHLPCNFVPFLRLRAGDIGDDGPCERANGTGDECKGFVLTAPRWWRARQCHLFCTSMYTDVCAHTYLLDKITRQIHTHNIRQTFSQRVVTRAAARAQHRAHMCLRMYLYLHICRYTVFNSYSCYLQRANMATYVDIKLSSKDGGTLGTLKSSPKGLVWESQVRDKDIPPLHKCLLSLRPHPALILGSSAARARNRQCIPNLGVAARALAPGAHHVPLGSDRIHTDFLYKTTYTYVRIRSFYSHGFFDMRH